jgi:hypothetical protein
MSHPLDEHYKEIIKAIAYNRLVPFLGAGVNLWGRNPSQDWQPGSCLPSGIELAQYLAKEVGYPPDNFLDLARVAQYVAFKRGSGPLYDDLHDLFVKPQPPEPNDLHRFLARLPAVLRDKKYTQRVDDTRPRLLIITTNYDDLLEYAFNEKDEKYHVVFYGSDPDGYEDSGRFFHRLPGCDKVVLIKTPNTYYGLNNDRDPVILKIHGAVDRNNFEKDSFVITEDDYIEYLARTDKDNYLPATLMSQLHFSQFLFMGYGLRDWNLRVILRRIWDRQSRTFPSWSIQMNTDELEEDFWKSRGVTIFNHRLEDYIPELDRRIKEMPAAGGGA